MCEKFSNFRRQAVPLKEEAERNESEQEATIVNSFNPKFLH